MVLILVAVKLGQLWSIMYHSKCFVFSATALQLLQNVVGVTIPLRDYILNFMPNVY